MVNRETHIEDTRRRMKRNEFSGEQSQRTSTYFTDDLSVVAKSARLIFRKMTSSDIPQLCRMLQDAEVMYAWEHAFTKEEVTDWLKKRKRCYEMFGYDYFLAVEKTTGEVVGQIGLLDEKIDGYHYTGIGYILNKEFWHKGYATEGAKAMLSYAFDILQKNEVIATIRPENTASRKVAENIGMKVQGEFVKRYNGKDMPHLVYILKRKSFKDRKGMYS